MLNKNASICIMSPYITRIKRVESLTTTIFRKHNGQANIYSDSRVTWVGNRGLPQRWLDPVGYRKTIMIDDVLYGFAGANVMYKIFLENYTTLDESEFLLDTCVDFAKQASIQFFIIRYDGQNLKLFAYSPPGDENIIQPEIYRVSKDPCIEKEMYAIGSGKYSKEFKRNRNNKNSSFIIQKIIAANKLGMKKQGMLDLGQTVMKRVLTLEESAQAYHACRDRGGDVFTGGDINMSQNATKQQIREQVELLERMDQEAKAANAVCASPVDAASEVRELSSQGQYSISPHIITRTPERQELFNKMRATLNRSC